MSDAGGGVDGGVELAHARARARRRTLGGATGLSPSPYTSGAPLRGVLMHVIERTHADDGRAHLPS